MSRKSVFDLYSHEYDLMTDAAAREKYHRVEVDTLVDRFKPETALDAGCASGLTSKLLAERGIETIGLDRSRKMVEVARGKHRGLDLPLAFRVGHFERLPESLNGKFDLIVCLANAISGLESLAGLRAGCRGFYRLLRPQGTLVIQCLNYLALKDGETFPIKATLNDGILYSRFSRRRGKQVEINAIRIDLNVKPIRQEPFVHSFDNFTINEVTKALEAARFKTIHKFGDLRLTRRFSQKGRDLVLVASR